MKLLAVLFILLNIWTDVPEIEKIAVVNDYKSRAQKALDSKDYEEATELYSYLVDSLNVNDASIRMNLGRLYNETGKVEDAKKMYGTLQLDEDKKVASLANERLGVIMTKEKKLEEALSFFKDAMKADYTNENARYNYELVKKMLEDQKNQEQQNQDQENQDEENKDQDQNQEDKDKQEQKDQNKDNQQENKDKQNQEGQDKEQEQKEDKGKENEEQKNEENKEQDQKDGEQGDKSDEQQDESQEGDESKDEKQSQPTEEKSKEEEKERQAKQKAAEQRKRMEQIKMSPEQANMILNALKNKEVQYYQQMKKRPTKRPDSDKPDW